MALIGFQALERSLAISVDLGFLICQEPLLWEFQEGYINCLTQQLAHISVEGTDELLFIY